MHGELISIPTDTDPLDGMYYAPAEGPIRGGVLIFHGNAMNFYTGPPRFLPPHLVAAGFACLTFNRRGHDILGTVASRRAVGGAYQTAAEGIADNEAAAGWMAARGFARPVVVGHSNGGMLGAQFAASHPEVRALVLMSAHRGGPHSYLRSCAAGLLAAEQGEEYLERAMELTHHGRGDELLLLPNWWYAISAASLVDRHENTPDLLESARAIGCPTLFVLGDRESPEVYPAAEFARHTQGPAQVRTIEETDHWYTGKTDVVARVVARWLVETC